MSKVISNVRNLRKRGKTKLVRISDQMNDLAWELSEKNDKVNDSHTAKSIAMLDESLALMQRALGLLNSVSIDPNMLVEDEKPVAKRLRKKLVFSQKAIRQMMLQKKPCQSQRQLIGQRLSRH